jgi:hypothetical protein
MISYEHVFHETKVSPELAKSSHVNNSDRYSVDYGHGLSHSRPNSSGPLTRRCESASDEFSIEDRF